MPGVNYVIYCCFSVRTTPGISLYWNLTLDENIVAAITQEKVTDDNLKKVNWKLCLLVGYPY